MTRFVMNVLNEDEIKAAIAEKYNVDPGDVSLNFDGIDFSATFQEALNVKEVKL